MKAKNRLLSVARKRLLFGATHGMLEVWSGTGKMFVDSNVHTRGRQRTLLDWSNMALQSTPDNQDAGNPVVNGATPRCRETPLVMMIMSFWMLALITTGILCNILYTTRQPVWSPRDEIGHYDYIDRLSDLDRPSASDDISDYTFEITTTCFEWITPEPFDGTKQGMGLAGKSYEAQHPPLYYFLLAMPNRLIKAMHVDPPVQIMLLRLLQLCLVFAGILFVIPIFYKLHLLLAIDWFPGLFLSLCMLFTNSGYYYSLGNDSLSILACNATLFVYLVAWKRNRTVYDLCAAAMTAGCFLVKYTNAIMLIPHVIYCALLLRRQGRISARLATVLPTPFLLVGLYLVYNAITGDNNDFLGTATTKSYFAWWVLPVSTSREFLGMLLPDSINLEHMGLERIRFLAWIIPMLIAANTVFALHLILKRNTKVGWILALCTLMSLLVIVCAVLLNRFRPGVHWHIFRHYYGCMLFWWVSILGIFLFPARRFAAIVYFCLTILATLGMIVYVRMLVV